VIADRGGVYARDGKIGGHPPSIHPSSIPCERDSGRCVRACPACGVWTVVPDWRPEGDDDH